MKRSELINFLDQLYHFNKQEEWDNCGVLPNKYKDKDITNVFISLDMNYDSLKKAITNNCDVIITHHPILISEENNIIDQTNKKLMEQLKQKDIINIALHTCFDINEYGTSYLIYELLNKKIKFVKKEYKQKDSYLIYIDLETKIKLKSLAKKISNIDKNIINKVNFLNVQKNNYIKSLCIGAGSCCSMMNDVIKQNVDCFMTADIKWHNYLDALNNNLNAIDIGHIAERVFIKKIEKLLYDYNIKSICDYKTIKIDSK